MKLDYFIILYALALFKSISSVRLSNARSTVTSRQLEVLKMDVESIARLAYHRMYELHNEDHILASKFLYMFSTLNTLYAGLGEIKRKKVTHLLYSPDNFWKVQSSLLHAGFNAKKGLKVLEKSSPEAHSLLEFVMGTAMLPYLVPKDLEHTLTSTNNYLEDFIDSSLVDNYFSEETTISSLHYKAIIAIVRTTDLVKQLFTLGASGTAKSLYRSIYMQPLLEVQDTPLLFKTRSAFAYPSDLAFLTFVLDNGSKFENFKKYYVKEYH